MAADGSSTKAGINVGDAILTFIGDVTQLDRAIDKVNAETAIKLEPSKVQAREVAAAFNGIGAAAELAAVHTTSGFQAMYRAGMSYNEFTKENMTAARNFAGTTQGAMKVIGEAWAVAKQAAASGAAAQAQAQTEVTASAVQMSEAWMNVSKATVEHQAAQQSLRQVLADVKRLGDADTVTMIALAQAQQRVAQTGLALAEAESLARQEITAATKAQTTALQELITVEEEQKVAAATPVPITARPDPNSGMTRSQAEAADAAATKAAYAEIGMALDETTGKYVKVGAAAQEAGTAQKASSSEAAAGAKVNAQAQMEAGLAAERTAIAANTEAAGWDKVSLATIEAREASAVVNAMLKEMAAGTLPRTARSAQDLAIAQSEAAAAAQRLRLALQEVGQGGGRHLDHARGAGMMLNHELGLGADRHLMAWISRLPVVGAALNAAFSAIAVVMLVQILIEGIKKLQEWHEKQRLIKEGWIEVRATFADVNDDMKAKLDEQEQKWIELTQGPVAAFEFALKNLRSTASDTLGKIKTEIDAVQKQFDQSAGWMPKAVEPYKQESEQIKKLYLALQEARTNAMQSNPGDLLAQYGAMANVASNRTIELRGSIKSLQDQIDAGFKNQPDPQLAIRAAEEQLKPLREELQLLELINGQLREGHDLDQKRLRDAQQQEVEAKKQREAAMGNANINAERQVGLARIALHDEQNRILFERGRISADQESDLLQKSENKKYQIELNAMNRRLELAKADSVKNPAAVRQVQGEIEVLQLTHQANLLKIDQDAYKQRASADVAFVQEIIAGTKQGSEERLAAEEMLSTLLKNIWGEQSDAYKQQQAKIAEARKQNLEVIRRLAQEEAKTEVALADDAAAAKVRLYQYMVQTYRMTNAQLIQLQIQSEQDEITRKREALRRQLTQLGPEEVLARAQINGQIKVLDQQLEDSKRLGALQTADILESYYRDLGMASEESYNRQVGIAQQAYNQILASGASAYQKLRAEMEYLQVAMKAALNEGDFSGAEAYQQRINEITAALERFSYSLNKVNILSLRFFDNWHKQAPKTRDLARQMYKTMQDCVEDLAEAEASAIAAWILGQESLGTAMRKATAQVLAEYAARAAVEAIYWTAYGFAMLASQQYQQAADAFTAAAMLGAFAVVAGAMAYAINPKDKEEAGAAPETQAAAGIEQGQTSNTPAAISAGGPNVPHFAGGGLILQPTLAMMGDAVSNSNQPQAEAALPLENPEAMTRIAEALGPYLGAHSGPKVYVEGLISPDNLVKVISQIDRAVKRNDVQLTSSNSYRVTRKA